MKDDTRMRTMMAAALVLALAAMLAGPAGARPIDDTGKTLTAAERASLRPDDRGGLQGVGSVVEPQVAIPYVSQGQGVDASQFRGDPSRIERQPVPAQPVQATDDDRTGWIEPTTFGIAMAGLLLGGMALLATRRRHEGDVAL
jgi:hypothetical protein